MQGEAFPGALEGGGVSRSYEREVFPGVLEEEVFS